MIDHESRDVKEWVEEKLAAGDVADVIERIIRGDVVNASSRNQISDWADQGRDDGRLAYNLSYLCTQLREDRDAETSRASLIAQRLASAERIIVRLERRLAAHEKPAPKKMKGSAK